MLEKHLRNSSLLYLVVEILQLVLEISSFSEVFYKGGVLKKLLKIQINTKTSHPEVFCQKMFLKILQNLQKNIFARVSFLIKLQAGNLKLAETAAGDGL